MMVFIIDPLTPLTSKYGKEIRLSSVYPRADQVEAARLEFPCNIIIYNVMGIVKTLTPPT